MKTSNPQLYQTCQGPEATRGYSTEQHRHRTVLLSQKVLLDSTEPAYFDASTYAADTLKIPSLTASPTSKIAVDAHKT